MSQDDFNVHSPAPVTPTVPTHYPQPLNYQSLFPNHLPTYQTIYPYQHLLNQRSYASLEPTYQITYESPTQGNGIGLDISAFRSPTSMVRFQGDIPQQDNSQETPKENEKPKGRNSQKTACHDNSECSVCGTRKTPLWRRSVLGKPECNACNLYFRKNNCPRPRDLQHKPIVRRNRTCPKKEA
ncbi:hypothetical protein L596_016114 [Steinernema carpocapsae]|uniref:GATA-type domain-containing protein n=1 Tax=Steinernema carpocapsae TaxID=34508 RepID=A0A4U5NH13_STECR|nr:hypothetical protein L596_016114 [Steinernema carpocapsae]